jgi:hypothetical protein
MAALRAGRRVAVGVLREQPRGLRTVLTHQRLSRPAQSMLTI